jgi:hypothetical protein
MRPKIEISMQLRYQIRPVLEMLKSKKTQMRGNEWTDFVRRMEQSIVNSPDQYLSDSSKEDKIEIIHYLFDEFLNANTTPSNHERLINTPALKD